MLEQAFSSVTSFLTGIIVARSCSMQTAGLYTLVLSISMVVLGVQRVVIAVPFNVHYPKLDRIEKKEAYCRATMGIECIFLIFAGAVGFVYGTVIYREIGGLVLLVFFTGYLGKDFCRQILFGQAKVLRCLAMSIAQCLGQIGFLTGFRDQLTLGTVLMGIGFSCLGSIAVFCFPQIRLTLKKKELQRAWKVNWWTAKWSIGISMSDSVKNQMSVWMLNLFQSEEAVAIYNNNNVLATLPQPVFVGLSQFLLPNLAASIHHENMKETLKKVYGACFITALANILWCFALLFSGEWLVAKLYGDAYYIGRFPLLICCVRGIFVSLNNVQNAVLQAYGKPQIIFYTLLIALFFLSTIGAVMIWKSGILGVCVTMLIVYVIPVTMQAHKILRLERL